MTIVSRVQACLDDALKDGLKVDCSPHVVMKPNMFGFRFPSADPDHDKETFALIAKNNGMEAEFADPCGGTQHGITWKLGPGWVVGLLSVKRNDKPEPTVLEWLAFLVAAGSGAESL